MKWKTTRRIALWLILASIALLITGTLAAYTRVEYVKRVVSSKNEARNFLFSSTYLYLRDSSSSQFPLRMISVSPQADVAVTVTVCNYLQSDLTRVNEEMISYNFTARLVDGDGSPLSADKVLSYQNEEGQTISITVQDLINNLRISNTDLNSEGVYTASGSLDGGTAATHFYEITCAEDYAVFLNNVCIQMEAVPAGSSQEKLVALLILSSGSQSGTPWSGKFTEVTSDSQSTTNLDAFNYVISGTENTTVQISWDAAHVTLSQWSMELFDGADIEETGNNFIKVRVGEAGTSYTLQFYRVNGIPDDETGATVRGYVTFLDAGN